jgi:hypothetical protein
MKKHWLFWFFLLPVLASYGQTIVKPAGPNAIPLIQRIIYSGGIQYDNADQMIGNWWIQALEPSVQHKFIGSILKKVESGALTVFETSYPYTIPLSKEEALKRLVKIDTIAINSVNDDPNSVLILKKTADTVQSESIRGMAFDEEWRFDKTSRQFVKSVKGIGLFLTTNDPSDASIKKMEKLFYIRLNDASGMDLNEKTLLTDRIEFATQIAPDRSDPDTADVIHYLTQASRNALRSSLFDAVKTGTVTAYDPVFPYTRAFTRTEINTIFQRKNSFCMADQVDPQKMDTFMASGPLKSADIEKLTFCEAWYFDIDKMTMCKKVRGVILNQTIFNDTLQSSGVMDLFYIPLNGSGKEISKPKPTTVSQIEYVVKGIGINDSTSTVSGIDTAFFSRFRTDLMNRAKNDRMNVYSSAATDLGNGTESFQQVLNKEDVRHIFYATDTILVSADPINPDSPLIPKVITTELDLNDISGLRFDEEWSFVPETMKFSKRVRGLFPLLGMRGSTGEFRGFSSLFYVSLNNQPASPDGIDEKFLIGTNVSYMMPLKGLETYDPSSQDIPYSPVYDNYLEMSKRESIIQKIMDNAMNGKIKVYAGDKLHNKLLNPAEVKGRMEIINPEDANLPFAKKELLNYRDIDGIKFYESWCYDKTRNSFYKQVKGIALGYSMGNAEEGKFVMLFYVPMNP